jgi:hypothetical protein
MTERQQMISRNGQQAANAGITCTFVAENGRKHTSTLSGSPTWALGELCDEALEIDPTMKLLSYSTPDTIYSDLNGRHTKETHLQVPELQVLGRIGRREMCHPSLIGEDAKSRMSS